MTKLNPLFRAVATATAIPGACMLALMFPGAATAASTAAKAPGAKSAGTAATGESTPLNLAPVSSGTHTSGSGASIVRTIVGLAIVIAVIWGLSWILRQVKGGRSPAIEGAGLTSLGALTLSTGRSVHLVRAGSDYILLGSAEQGVVPIHRYTEEEAREAGIADVIDAAERRPRRQLLRPPPPPPPAPGTPAPRHDPMRMPSPGPAASMVDRLRELTVRR